MSISSELWLSPFSGFDLLHVFDKIFMILSTNRLASLEGGQTKPLIWILSTKPDPSGHKYAGNYSVGNSTQNNDHLSHLYTTNSQHHPIGRRSFNKTSPKIFYFIGRFQLLKENLRKQRDQQKRSDYSKPHKQKQPLPLQQWD